MDLTLFADSPISCIMFGCQESEDCSDQVFLQGAPHVQDMRESNKALCTAVSFSNAE